MSDVSLRTKALALIECVVSERCARCSWYRDEVCKMVYHKTEFIVTDLLDENERLEEENAVLRERIAIMEVEMEDDLK